MALLSELGIGNFNARTEVVAQDELGVMASSLNAMLDNMTTMIQSQGDQEKLQEAFMKLMMEIDELTEARAGPGTPRLAAPGALPAPGRSASCGAGGGP